MVMILSRIIFTFIYIVLCRYFCYVQQADMYKQLQTEQVVSALYASSSKCFFNEDKPLLAEIADLFKVYINISRAY